MVVFLFIGVLIALYFLLQKPEEAWLTVGKEHYTKHFKQDGKEFISEQALFGSSQETVYHLFQIVYQITKREGFLEEKYDWYDFSYNIFRYEHTTVKLLRFQNYIQLIRSAEPLSIEEMERINPHIPIVV